MNDPASYRKAEFFKSDLKLFFDECKATMHWRPDGKDSLLDIGCAGGNITVDVIHALLPKTFSRLVGVDINETMIGYAKANFQIPQVSFEVLDIGCCDITGFLTRNDRFDHITSSLCLHLVPDQRQTLLNIFNLLQPKGDCLLYVLVDCPVFDIYVQMEKKWLPYMEDVDDYISPYYRRVNPEYLLKKHLNNAGFTRYEVKRRTRTLVFHDVQKFKDTYHSVIPFFRRMSPAEQEEFMQEFVQLAVEMTKGRNDKLTELIDDSAEVVMPYQLLTVFAIKD